MMRQRKYIKKAEGNIRLQALGRTVEVEAENVKLNVK